MPDQHVIIEDEALRHGFTQIPNQILRRPDLPPGAKLVYMVLLSYAWQKDQAYPGQDRLSEDMGVSERSVRTYLDQLVESGLITIRRRGLGLTNVYIIHRLSGPANIAGQPRPEKLAALDRKESAPTELQDLPQKKTQDKKTQVEEDPSNSSIELPLIMSKEDAERISWVLKDIAREFRDASPLKSTATRVLGLYAGSGFALDEFLDLIQAARVRTQRYSGNIKTEGKPSAAGFPQKNKMPYFLTVLADLLKDSDGRKTG